jgi:hypothetical protein
MKTFVLLAGIAALCATSVTADAKHRRRYYDPYEDNVIYLYEDEDDDSGYYVDEEEEVIFLNRRKRMREAERRVEEDMWWVEERARKKIEKRAKLRKTVEKPAPKKTVKPKVVKEPADPIKTASLSKPVVVAKPKPVVAAKPKTDLPKPVVASKTIGCTAGAAVITGYGFGEVKPKVCTGATYAYSATRSGKAYEIKLTSASGEITDVRKLN